MKKTILTRVVALVASVNLLLLASFLVQAPTVLSCTFAALKSVTLVTDPPRPVKGKPFTLDAVLLFGGGMGHGNMLTAAENAISTTLTMPEGMRLTKGNNPLQTTSPYFTLGYETTVTLTWEAVAEKSGRQRIGVEATNITLGQGQESSATENVTGLLAWEVVQPSMKDARIESGMKEGIDAGSLSRMPSLSQKEWRTLANGDVVFTDADGTRYSAAADELALGKDDPSPVLATDANGNQYLASDGYVVVGEGPQVFAPVSTPAHPNPKDPVTVQAKIIGDMAQGKALLFYSTDGAAWQQVEMSQVPGESLWKGEIPAQSKDGLSVNYYLQVTDSAGQTVTLPRYSVRFVASSRVDEGIRNTVLITITAILLGIAAVVAWAKWDLSKRARRARAGERRILAGGQLSFQPQRITGVLAQLRRPAAARSNRWWIGFWVLMILGVILSVIGILINQFQIINLIIKMG